MPVTDYEGAEFERNLLKMPAAKPVDPTGFSENFSAGFGVFWDEETSVSEYLNSGAYDERDRDMDRKIVAGDLDVKEWTDKDGDVDYSRAAYDLKRRGVEVLDDYDVRDGIRADLTQRRNYAMDVMSRADWAGSAGSFLGTAAAAQLDPINAGAMFIPGIALLRTGTALAKAGKAAAYYGTAVVGTESIIQGSFVMDWKEKMGVEYNASDAAYAIALAGATGGVFAGGVSLTADGVAAGYRATKEAVMRKAPEGERKKLIKEIESAEAKHDWHVQTLRRERILSRVRQARAANQAARQAGKEKEMFNEDLIADWEELVMREEGIGFADIERTEQSFKEYQASADEMFAEITATNEIDPATDAQVAMFFREQADNDALYLRSVDSKFDAEQTEINRRMEEEDLIEQDEVLNAVNNDLSKWDPPEEPQAGRESKAVTGDVFTDFDEGQFAAMTPEQRDAYMNEILGGDINDVGLDEYVGLDGDGNAMYETKSRADIDADIDAEIEAIDNFMDCWRGTDGET